MIQVTLEENQARCDFFKHFQYNTKDKLGTVSVINKQASKQPLSVSPSPRRLRPPFRSSYKSVKLFQNGSVHLANVTVNFKNSLR